MADQNNNVGPKRLVVGARYGLKDWLVQRATAAVMAIYTIVLLITFLTSDGFTYTGWAGMFAHQWFKVLTFVTLLSLFYHAWVGMRDIWMDYIKPLLLRLILEVLTILWLIGCAGWAAQILWRA
jgi:succinate dehydrogenase / fumarate reductase membrane anchor subunit